MLTSTELHQAVDSLGFMLELGKKQPTYAYEHYLGNSRYLYIKRKGKEGGDVASPLVLDPSIKQLRTAIDNIPDLLINWDEYKKSTSYRKYPKLNGEKSQCGYAGEVKTIGALTALLALLNENIAQQTDLEYLPMDDLATEDIVMPPLNQIFYGPPGTSKTYHALEAAVIAAEPEFVFEHRGQLKEKYDQLVNDNRIHFVTFHQSYGYEEFVEGLTAQTNDGDIHYDVAAGIFKQICLNDSRENQVLIIDEINRGNISKIFGELITLIEPSKRAGADEALTLTLPYSSDKLSVPNNLYIIGTMNTADRSLAMIDTALRRRFDFIEMMPDPSIFADTEVYGINLKQLLTTINQRIEVLYDREHTLGHAFFMPVKLLADNGNEKAAFSELVTIFKNKIIPLLEEYFFEDWHKIRLVLGDNQKRSETQFIKETTLTHEVLKALFGSEHTINTYGEQQSQYQLKNNTAAVWLDPHAYYGIYATLSSDATVKGV